MTENTIVNLLIVDRIDVATQVLRDGGYIVQTERLEQEAEVINHIQSKSVDIIIARPLSDLISTRAIRNAIKSAHKKIPLIVAIDDQCAEPIQEVVGAGADALWNASDANQLIALVKKELEYRHLLVQAKEFEAKLEEAESRSRKVMDQSEHAIAYIHEGVHMYANPAYLRLFGYANTDDLMGVTLMDMVSSGDRNQVKRFLRDSTKQGSELEPLNLAGLRTDGSEVPVTMHCTPTRIDDEPCLQISIAVDEGAEDAAAANSQHDALTQLYSRTYFVDHLDRRLNDPAHKRDGAILYVLLEAYRPLNSRFGLAAGNVLVSEQAKTLQETLTDDAVVARFADGAFAVLLPETGISEAMKIAKQLCEAIKSRTAYLDQSLLTTNASIGVVSLSSDYEHGSIGLISLADKACENARRAGGNRVIDGSTTDDAETESENNSDDRAIEQISAAISSERLRLLYQPVVSFADDDNERFQAILEILDENDKPLDMAELVPVAERTNLMLPLDKWIIVSGLGSLTERYQEHHCMATLFVQISGNSLADSEFCGWLEAKIKDTGLPTSTIIVEILENTAEKHFKESKPFREQLRNIGCGFSLANFGGKANSERILNHLTPDYIKLDSDFLEKQSKSKSGNIKAITDLTQQAQAMNIQVVAANITNANQMASIWQFGVTLVQGDMVHQPDSDMSFDFAEFAAG